MTKYYEQEKNGQCPLLYLGLIVWYMLPLKCVTAWSLSDPSLCTSNAAGDSGYTFLSKKICSANSIIMTFYINQYFLY